MRPHLGQGRRARRSPVPPSPSPSATSFRSRDDSPLRQLLRRRPAGPNALSCPDERVIFRGFGRSKGSGLMRASRIAAGAAVVLTTVLVSAGSALAVTINAFSPKAGLAQDDPYCPGGHVTITRTGFVGDGGVPTVMFGGNVRAIDVQVGSDTTLNVMVPNGAQTGPITVTTPLGTATTQTLAATDAATPIGELKLPNNLF